MALPKRNIHRRALVGAQSFLPRRFKMAWNKGSPQQLPRSSAQRIQLALLSWFLREELPKKFPDTFPCDLTVEAITEQGWSNLAFLASGHHDQRYMVRMRAGNPQSAESSWSPYHKESWILKSLGSTVPHPEVIANGIAYVRGLSGETPYSYFIQSYLPYRSADQIAHSLPAIDFRIQLGKIARAINQIPCLGYGSRFDCTTNSFGDPSWQVSLQREVAEAGFDQAIDAGFISSAGALCLKKRITSLEHLNVTPSLYHIDFAENWSNVLIDDQSQVKGIIDWELAGSGPALHQEFSNILYVMHRDGRSKSEIERLFGAFLTGYGLSYQDYREHFAYDVETLILLMAVQKLRRYLDIDRQGKLREHRWRVAFFERCGELVRLGARLSECEDRRILLSV